MIETTLFFILGFLSAGFLALLVAPAIWRRAVALTRKRVEASVPLTMGEIQADKDRMRAEFAMTARKLEMNVKSLKEKATNQTIDIDRMRGELKRVAGERDAKNRAIEDIEARAAELRAELKQREEQLQRANDRFAEHDKLLEDRSREMEKLAGMFDEASFSASSRQIELVAQESKFDKLSEDVGALRTERKEADKRVRDITVENKALEEAIRAEKRSFANLEKKTDRLTTELADRDDKIERYERDLARLREQTKKSGLSDHAAGARLAEEQEERMRLEDEVADLKIQMAKLLADSAAGDAERDVPPDAGRKRLEERLTVLTRENRKLRASVENGESSAARAEEDGENAALREQIQELAAQVVTLTAKLEGPDSPINDALASAPAGEGEGGDAPSLAERIRQLQEAAARG